MIVNGQERADGLEVSKWGLRFSGTHDLEIDDAEKMGLDKVIIFLCATRAGKFEVQVLDDGEVKRKNVANVTDFMILQGELRERAISALANGSDHGLIIFDQPVHTGEHPAAGEVDKLAAYLMDRYPAFLDRSEGAVDMACRLLDDPHVAGVLNGTLAVVDVETGERLEAAPLGPLEQESESPTVVEDAPESQLEPLPEDELDSDPGWDPRDLPEPRAEDEPPITDPRPKVETEPEPESSGGEPAGPPRGTVVGSVKDRRYAPDGPPGGRSGPGVAKFDPADFDDPPKDAAARPAGGPERVGVGAHHKDPMLRKFLEED